MGRVNLLPVGPGPFGRPPPHPLGGDLTKSGAEWRRWVKKKTPPAPVPFKPTLMMGERLKFRPRASSTKLILTKSVSDDQSNNNFLLKPSAALDWFNSDEYKNIMKWKKTGDAKMGKAAG